MHTCFEAWNVAREGHGEPVSLETARPQSPWLDLGPAQVKSENGRWHRLRLVVLGHLGTESV